LWVWLVGLVALLIVYGVILWPQQKQLFALKQQVRESNQRLERLQQAQSSGFQQRIRRELQALQQQYDALCFEPGDLSRLDFRIHDLASQCRVNKFSSQNAQGKEDKYFTNLTLTDQRKLEVVVDTDFSSFLRLINALERNKPALFIHEMVLSNSFFSEVEELPTGKIEFSALYAKKQ
jgi:hypothetical protein